MVQSEPIIPLERIASRIYLIRGEKVMLDSDLAELYGVKTKVLLQAVKRNIERFPGDFLFQFSKAELENWRSQIVTSNPAAKMGLRRPPYAFTEQGVAMLSSVLRSKRAVQVNIAIMRAFVRLRQILASNRELARKVERHDRQIGVLFEAVRKLLAPPPAPKKHPIGFTHRGD
ncbi:MAG TPA: ORF6N domain-containing protein [Candidatus Binataceae bacterium]|nr:ORF6N domain-containing protein [Candidatus Binataceae bacterium]